jgi:dTMP kinase
LLFTFDGVDGVGKSTQIRLFADWLTERGYEVVTCVDPGSTPLGRRVRELLLDPDEVPIGRRAEMLLFMAARAQLVDEVIAPALAASRIVLSDRYLLSNVVYQGHAGGLDVDALWQVGEVATRGIRPRLTFLLDMDHQRASGRLNRPRDRMEQQGDDFQQRLRDGFLEEARRCPQEIVVINAADSVEAVQQAIRSAAEPLLPDAGQLPGPQSAKGSQSS